MCSINDSGEVIVHIMAMNVSSFMHVRALFARTRGYDPCACACTCVCVCLCARAPNRRAPALVRMGEPRNRHARTQSMSMTETTRRPGSGSIRMRFDPDKVGTCAYICSMRSRPPRRSAIDTVTAVTWNPNRTCGQKGNARGAHDRDVTVTRP